MDGRSLHLHFVNFRLPALHLAHDCSAFWVLDPSSDVAVGAVVAAVLCESDAWKRSKLVGNLTFDAKVLPWTWPKTSKSHWTNKFVSSIPITLWKIHFLQLCHHSIASELQLIDSNWKPKSKVQRLLRESSAFLLLHFHQRKKKKSFCVFFSLSRDIFRLNFPIRLTLIDARSLNLTTFLLSSG